MLYQNNKNKPYVNQYTLSLIREASVTELEAIMSYKNHLLQSDNKELNAKIREILNDEQDHIDILFDILSEYDSTQDEFFKKVTDTMTKINDYGNNYVSDNYNVENTLIKEIQAELNAISSYESKAKQISNIDIRQKLLLIADDEKEHLAELDKILKDIENQPTLY